MLVESEQWTQAEVPFEFQQIADRIVQGQTKDYGLETTKNLEVSPSSETPSGLESKSSSSSSIFDDERDSLTPQSSKRISLPVASSSKRSLLIQGKKFYVVGCVLMFLRTLLEYVQCLENISDLTMDVMNKILEILKVSEG